jgi:hypothetical protein
MSTLVIIHGETIKVQVSVAISAHPWFRSDAALTPPALGFVKPY